MTNNDSKIEMIIRKMFEKAKKWFFITSILRIVIVIINIILLYTQSIELLSLTPSIIAIFIPITQWTSDKHKRFANRLLGKLELAKGFGWSITSKELSDIFFDIDDINNTINDNYFFSQGNPSPKIALQNLEESAWWTKNLSLKMFRYILILIIIITVFIVTALLITINNKQLQSNPDIINKITIALITLIVSGGYIRACAEYYRLFEAAKNTEDRANTLKNQPNLSEREALKLVYEYQLARSSSPLIPDWLWKWHREKLNKLWIDRVNQE